MIQFETYNEQVVANEASTEFKLPYSAVNPFLTVLITSC